MVNTMRDAEYARRLPEVPAAPELKLGGELDSEVRLSLERLELPQRDAGRGVSAPSS